MKNVILLILISIFAINCADSKDLFEDDQYRRNLFTRSGEVKSNDELKDLKSNLTSNNSGEAGLIGLWQSEEFEVNNFVYQIMWEVTEKDTTLAIKCRNVSSLNPLYTQVSLDYTNSDDDEGVAQESDLSMYDFPIATESKKVNSIELPFDERCRVAFDASKMADSTLLASDSHLFTINNDEYENGILVLDIIEPDEGDEADKSFDLIKISE